MIKALLVVGLYILLRTGSGAMFPVPSIEPSTPGSIEAFRTVVGDLIADAAALVFLLLIVGFYSLCVEWVREKRRGYYTQEMLGALLSLYTKKWPWNTEEGISKSPLSHLDYDDIERLKSYYELGLEAVEAGVKEKRRGDQFEFEEKLFRNHGYPHLVKDQRAEN